MSFSLRRSVIHTSVLLLACWIVPLGAAAAQTCASGNSNSCMSVTFTPVRPTPEPADFQAGFAVLGSLNVTVLKCGRRPCEVTLAAATQPPTGLRIKVGGTQPTRLADCAIDITGISAAPSSQAPTIAFVNAAAAITVWVCQPLSWDPLRTPVGTYTPEFRFRLRQG
ncbi:hypothetical protein [Gemmatimonas sp.]|uniref:hypothetical protein n=1 Tax=Gemmatimonas sp. TaxID=1962908 RepID=UPI0037BF3C9D